MLETGVCCVGRILLWGQVVLFEVWVVRWLMSDLARFGRPLMMTCMCCVGNVWSDDLACLDGL
jgi:hypothetical protein